MIVIKIEMWPLGNESKATEFARAIIVNNQVKSIATKGTLGTYDIKLYGGVYGREDLLKKIWKRGEVENFDRVKQGVWHLLFKGLKSCLGNIV